MTTYFAREEFTGDGSTHLYPVYFQYIDPGHIQVYVNSVWAPYTWVNPGLISITTAPPNGSAIVITRATQQSLPIVVFQDASVLTKVDLETANKQAVYMAQEAIDLANASVGTAALDAAIAAAQAAQAAAEAAAAAAVDAANWTDTHALIKTNNLSDLTNSASARVFLGLGSAAIHDEADFATSSQGSKADSALQAAYNLADVNSVSASRTNLGLDTAALYPESHFSVNSNNLSDLTNKSAARGFLGLGSAAVHDEADFATSAQGSKADSALQAASNLSDVNSATTSLSNLGGLPKAGGTMTGAIVWSGTALRNQADLSNATHSSRLIWQSSTVNGVTAMGTMPNGTGSSAGWNAYVSGSGSNTDVDNSSLMQFQINNSTASVNINSAKRGTGTTLPMNFQIDSVTKGTLTTAGNWEFVGNITKMNNVATSWPSANAAGVLTNDGAGTFSWLDPTLGSVSSKIQAVLGSARLCGSFVVTNGSVGSFPSGTGWTAPGSSTVETIDYSTAWKSVPKLIYVTSSPAGSSLEYRQSSVAVALLSTSGLGGFTFFYRGGVHTAAATSRSFFGLQSSNGAFSNGDPSSLTDMVGFGNDSGDANLQIMCNDGSGTATKTSLGASFPAQTSGADVYEMILFAAPGQTTSISYRIKNLISGAETSGSLSSNLPTAATALYPRAWLNNGTTASVVRLGLINIGVQSVN